MITKTDSLRKILKSLNYNYKDSTTAGMYQKNIFDSTGKIVFTGDADSTWRWLRETNQIDF
ncbi:MAG TPA: hypothetical protein V6C58_21245 [Allocoleopsis sp.]